MSSNNLSFALVQQLVEAALEEATRQGLPVAVSVVDDGGHLLAFSRLDDAGYMSIEVTRRKAVTACNFRVPTQFVLKISQSDPALADDLAKNPEVCMVAGGLPIIIDGKCVGGLGVGGGRVEQDQAIAEKALASVFPENSN